MSLPRPDFPAAWATSLAFYREEGGGGGNFHLKKDESEAPQNPKVLPNPPPLSGSFPAPLTRSCCPLVVTGSLAGPTRKDQGAQDCVKRVGGSAQVGARILGRIFGPWREECPGQKGRNAQYNGGAGSSRWGTKVQEGGIWRK